MFSAHIGNKVLVDQMREAGVQHFFPKPLNVRALKTLISDIQKSLL